MTNPEILQAIKRLNEEIADNEDRRTNGRLTYWDGRYSGLILARAILVELELENDSALD